MLKLTFIIALILGIQIAGYGQWEQKNISTNSTLTCVDFLNEDIGFVTGGNKIFKTENGGDDWTTSYTANNFVFYEDIFIIDNEKVIAVGKEFNSNQSVITKTINGGTSWSEVTISNFSLLKSVFFISSTIGYCSGSGGSILKSTNSGDTWQALNSGTGESLESIYFVNDTVGIVVGGSPANGQILKTQDGGANWTTVNAPSDNYFRSVFFSNQETGYVVGWNGVIIKTTDSGDSWATQNSVAMTGNLEVLFTDENTGYIVGGSVNESLIQKTSNGGDLWEDISPQIPEGLVCVHFPSFNVGYAVGSGGTVVKTESGGTMASTNDVGIIEEFNVFPNPTNNTLNIHSENNNRIERMRIFDSNGRLIEELLPNSADCTIDLSDLESNIYYLEIHSDKVKGIKKIVKR